MRLARVRIEGYRCLKDVTLDLAELTVLLGSNSTGKSSVLRALRFFFEGDVLLAEDVFNGSENGLISIQASFDALSPADRAAFGIYALGGQMVLRRTWHDGSVKMTGHGLRYDGFEPIRALAGVARRTAYKALREAQPDLELPEVTRVDEADAAMLRWEMEHPGRCAASDEDAGHLFGYPSVGRRKVNDRFKFIFVPGLQDASEQAVERKGTILERLLTAIADQRAEANNKLIELENRLRDEYAEVVESSHRPTLESLAKDLAEQMQRYLPTASIRLDPVAQELKIAPPTTRRASGGSRRRRSRRARDVATQDQGSVNRARVRA